MLQLFRFLSIVWRFRRQGRPRQTVARTPFRVRWLDCDAYRHMNNARYLAVMDLARMDHMLRAGLLERFRAAGLKPVVVDVQIKYRRELKPGQDFEVETTLLAQDSRKLIVRQRFLREETLHAEADVGMLFLRGRKVADAGAVQAMLAPLADALPPVEPAAARGMVA